MLPDRVSNPGPLLYESGARPIALCGPATGLRYDHVTGSCSHDIFLTLLHSEIPKLHTILAFLSAIGLISVDGFSPNLHESILWISQRAEHV